MAEARMPERRLQRSNDVATALAHRLRSARDEVALDAVVVASHEGLLLARAGDPELCERLAAMAPLYSDDPQHALLKDDLADTPISVSPVDVDGDAVFLAWSGHVDDDRWLQSAGAGVRRILAS